MTYSTQLNHNRYSHDSVSHTIGTTQVGYDNKNLRPLEEMQDRDRTTNWAKARKRTTGTTRGCSENAAMIGADLGTDDSAQDPRVLSADPYRSEAVKFFSSRATRSIPMNNLFIHTADSCKAHSPILSITIFHDHDLPSSATFLAHSDALLIVHLSVDSHDSDTSKDVGAKMAHRSVPLEHDVQCVRESSSAAQIRARTIDVVVAFSLGS
ncbi:uncharacterized protein MYCFIDRAFT_178524 [Pseudocercospora fijiensis CIRAD86]|uniref:Uncharacterized protein n=1 Tax=Pseudocercospora fijiensis (strain CIRAD86) TaxID=383855 RepID=M3A1W1_PSEFD|nr:uncharacterized protein MYCFIDRAFT_178524 [Pseudocercospora fijiensis CIRAD86]EME78376.1 hypothetical protein MYCFIDRAFT_178524 [Pseudocercospora fijiensis CIRAD86]